MTFKPLSNPTPSLPLQIRAYMNKFGVEEADHEWDLLALRFLSINSIVDPWVFAILRPPVLRLMCLVLRPGPLLCCRATPTAPSGPTASPDTLTKLPTRSDLCGQ